MDRYIICCAGSQKKWGNHRGVPSHLVKDRSGEPILHRTVRLLPANGEIVVLRPPGDDRYRLPGTASREGVPSALNEFWSSMAEWSTETRTVLLLGDVWFSEEAIDTILAPREGLRFFGRYGPSKITGSPWGELFASAWYPENTAELYKAMRTSRALFDQRKANRHIGWEILRAAQGSTDLNIHTVREPWFVEINDLTDDLDFPVDYQRHPRFGD